MAVIAPTKTFSAEVGPAVGLPADTPGWPERLAVWTAPPAHRLPRTADQDAVLDTPAKGWLARLAAWAERQPQHRRMGSWTAL